MLKRIAEVLEGVRWMSDGFVAKCPAHDDQKQSLKVDPRPDDPEGWPLMRCYAGCEFGAVREALEAKGVKAERREPQREAGGKTTTRYEVRSPEGVLIATKVRVDPGKMIWWELPDGTRGLRSAGLNTDDLLYRVEKLADNPGRPAVICEGEKAAEALARLGVKCALGSTGGANASLSRKALAPLRGREVFLWPDNDEAGRKHMAKIRAALAGIASAVYVISWPDAPEKGDAADWVRGKTMDDFAALAEDATREPAPEWSKAFNVAIREFMAEIDRRVSGTPSDAIPSGIRDLDAYIGGGFKPGEVYLWGAPTGGGKTTIMQSIAINVAKANRRVLLVSPEMTLVEIARRAVVREVQRPFDVWRDEQAAQPFIMAGAMLSALPIVLADKVDITMPEIVTESMRLSRESAGLGLVIVDYAQQVVDDTDPRARYLQVGDVAEKAVLIAKTLRVPVLVASQVNKTVPEKGKDTKPIYTFRESAKLEHKASVVLIFDRRFAFDPDAEETPDDDDRIDAKILCHKNRLGAQFRRVEVRWNLPLFTILDGPWDQGAIRAPEGDADGLVVAGTPPPDLPEDRQSSLLLND